MRPYILQGHTRPLNQVSYVSFTEESLDERASPGGTHRSSGFSFI